MEAQAQGCKRARLEERHEEFRSRIAAKLAQYRCDDEDEWITNPAAQTPLATPCTSSSQPSPGIDDSNSPQPSPQREDSPNRPEPARNPDESEEDGIPKLDISNAIGKKLTDEEKFRFLTQTWMPTEADFPEFSSERVTYKKHWMMNWFEEFKWLAFSKRLNGGLCKYCVVFKPPKKNIKKFYETAWGTNFNECAKMKAEMGNHERAHEWSEERACAFLSVHSGKQLNVHVHSTQASDKQFAERLSYGKRLVKIVSRVTLYLSKQNAAFRGKRNEGITSVDSDKNQGNFWETLKLLAGTGCLNGALSDCDANFLAAHLKSPKYRNAHHCGKETQNELIAIAGELIQRKLADNVRRAGYFSVLADETTDVSTKEQLAITVRYWLDGNLHEDTMDLVEAKSTTGQALKDLLLEFLEKLGLDPRLMRGLGFDGAANMSGIRNGCAALIQQDYPLALYVHCFAHTLNLVVVGTCDIQEIRNMFTTVQDICSFIGASAKRLDEWCSSFPADKKAQKLRTMSATRWASRANALTTMKDLLDVVLRALQNIAENDRTNRDRANALLAKVETFPFLVSLFSAQFILEFTNSVSARLQASQLDIVGAMKEVHSITDLVQAYREEDKFMEVFQEVLDTADRLEIPVSMPRLAVRQRNRANAPAVLPSQHYYRNIWLPFVDHFLTEMSVRFTPHGQRAMFAQFLVPELMALDASDPRSIKSVLKTPDTSSKSLFTALEPLFDVYSESIEKLAIRTELIRWKSMWSTREDKPSNLPCTLLQCPPIQFPNIHELLKVLVVLPVSTAECERTFSTLRRLKNYLRSTMSQDRLAGLMLMNIHLNKENSVNLTAEELMEEYISRKARRGMI